MKGHPGFQKFYKKLNPEQKKAVDIIDGPVLVVAGPGTGKTQVLTMRVANILLKTDTPPDAILALTFTDSGVRAMRERLISIVGSTAYYVNIHTFHSFASDVIKANPDEFAISTQLEPLSDLERIRIFKEIFDELSLNSIKPFNSPYFYLQASVSKIKNLKREGIDPAEYSEFISQSQHKMEKRDFNKNMELLEVYKSYQKKLKRYGRYDFEDMINFVIEKFNTSPALLKKYQERFQYFLVDEFQDTNSAQTELLYQLNSYWGSDPNLFVVGDDDQSIFRFQGASIENIVSFNEKYPNAVKIALTKNYRNVQPIIDASENVIKNNTVRVINKLKVNKRQKAVQSSGISKRVDDRVITVAEFSSSHTENHFIAKEIKKLIEKDKVLPHEIAVLYRNNADSIDITDMLSRMGVKYTMEGGENVLEAGVIIRLIHLLRVIQKVRTKDEDLDLFTLLNYEFLDVNTLDVLKLSRFASDLKINYFEALHHSDIKVRGLQNLERLSSFYRKLIEWNELSSNTTFIEFVEKVMEESGYLNWILNHPSSFEYLNKLNSFLSEVKRLNLSNKSLTLEQFLQYIELMSENNIAINEETLNLETNTVRLMTAHKAKGLEFEYVFVTKFIDKKWSNAMSRDLIKLPTSILKTIELTNEKDRKKHQEEDDRRLFFVVLTRAKKNIYITSAKSYQTYAYQRNAVPSMFFHELPEDNIRKFNVSDFEKDASAILRQLLKPKKVNASMASDEKAFLRQALRDFKLSPSSLNTYLECPYKFKLEFLFKTPRPRLKHFILGTAVHKALEVAYKKLMQKPPVKIGFLLDGFSKALSKEILNENEFIEIEKEGHSILKVYYKTYREEFSQKPKNLVLLEKFLGWGWSRPLLDGSILLQGKIDKIEVLDQSSSGIKITDYKTGRPRSRNDILGKTKYSKGDQYRQLLFYKLLIDLDNTFNYTVREVELDYVGHRTHKPKRESFKVSEEDMENLKKIIREVSSDMQNFRFQRTTEYAACQDCRYRFHCWPDGIPNAFA